MKFIGFIQLVSDNHSHFFEHFNFALNQRGSFGVVAKLVNELLDVGSQLLLGLVFPLLVLKLLVLRSNKIFIIAS